MGVMGVYADALMREAWVLTAVAIQNDRIQLAWRRVGSGIDFISRGFRTFAARK